MNRFKKDSLEVRVAESRAALGLAAAEAVCAGIASVLERKPVANVMFAAAPSQNEFLAALVTMPVDWSRVNGWHMDEYLGLDVNAPQRFGHFLRERLFGKVPFREVFYMSGAGGSAEGQEGEAECRRYAALLRTHPTDIVVLGIGENTHLAFNDPHVARFDDPEMVKVVRLDEACRRQQVNDGCFTRLAEVPERAMTVTIPGLMRADRIYGVVPGPRKAGAVAITLSAEITEAHPATVLRRHPRAVLFLDPDSAAQAGDGSYLAQG
ncbi:MAG TPA: 6-phosphogluconolactonase [Puia sp.]|nr:6-phosphogluconolactonase [Puia sp.]